MSPVLFPWLRRDRRLWLRRGQTPTPIMMIRGRPCRSFVRRSGRGRPAGSYAFLPATRSTTPPMSATAPKMGGSGTACVLFACSVNWSDVDDLFPGRIRKPTPRKTEQAKHYQNDAKRFAHGSPLRQRLQIKARKPTRGRGLPVLRTDLIVSTSPIRVPSDRASFELCRVAFRHGPRPLGPDCW